MTWVRSRSICWASTPARALSLVLPPPGKPRLRKWAARTAAPLEGERLTAGQRVLLDRLPGPAAEDLGALRRLEKRGLVTIVEQATAGPGALIPKPVQDVQLHVRNVEALRRLAFVVEGRAR